MTRVLAVAVVLAAGACDPDQPGLGPDGVRPGVQRVATCTVVAGETGRRVNPGVTNPGVTQDNIGDIVWTH